MIVSWDKLKANLEEKFKDGKIMPIYTLGRKWTPEEIIEEVRNETDAGIEFLMAEKRLQDELKKRGNTDDT